MTVSSSANIPAEEIKLGWEKAEANMRHFRTFGDISTISDVSSIGTQGRYISGSGQFSATNLYHLSDKVKSIAGQMKIIIVDLRLESHGLVNGLPVKWKNTNVGKSLKEIRADETKRLWELLFGKTIKAKNEATVKVKEVTREEEFLAVQQEFEYQRFPTRDHSHPSDEIVDNYLELIRKNPNAWLHLHCAVGKGRTTTFLTLYDMFYNAKVVSFDDLLKRQKAIGGEDFKKHINKPNKDSEKQNLYEKRLEFLERFYKFCNEADPQNMSWKAWHQQNFPQENDTTPEKTVSGL